MKSIFKHLNVKTSIMVLILVSAMMLTACAKDVEEQAYVKAGECDVEAEDLAVGMITDDNVTGTVKNEGSESNGKVFVIDDNSVDKSGALQAAKNPLEGRNVFFAGYVDATITKTSTVALENLPENKDFYMSYKITNKHDDSIAFETNLIPAGQCVIWTPGETLDVGKYELQILAVPYYCDTNGNYQELTSGCNNITYTITE